MPNIGYDYIVSYPQSLTNNLTYLHLLEKNTVPDLIVNSYLIIFPKMFLTMSLQEKQLNSVIFSTTVKLLRYLATIFNYCWDKIYLFTIKGISPEENILIPTTKLIAINIVVKNVFLCQRVVTEKYSLVLLQNVNFFYFFKPI